MHRNMPTLRVYPLVISLNVLAIPYIVVIDCSRGPCPFIAWIPLFLGSRPSQVPYNPFTPQPPASTPSSFLAVGNCLLGPATALVQSAPSTTAAIWFPAQLRTLATSLLVLSLYMGVAAAYAFGIFISAIPSIEFGDSFLLTLSYGRVQDSK